MGGPGEKKDPGRFIADFYSDTDGFVIGKGAITPGGAGTENSRDTREDPACEDSPRADLLSARIHR